MRIWQQEINLTIITNRGQNSMSDFLGIEFTEIGDHYLSARMPISAKVKQPIGIMHGGASCVLAETLASTAANFCVPSHYYCVGLDINTNHIRAIKEGFVIAKAEPYHLGKSTQVWGIDIHDENNKRISITRLTLAVLAKPS